MIIKPANLVNNYCPERITTIVLYSSKFYRFLQRAYQNTDTLIPSHHNPSLLASMISCSKRVKITFSYLENIYYNENDTIFVIWSNNRLEPILSTPW